MKRTPLSRKSPLRASRFQKVVQRSKTEQDVRACLALAFHDAAVRPGYCAACHVRPEHLHAHHCVEASFLKTELRNVVEPLRLDAILFDARNALGVCDRCHLNDHWSGRRRIYRKHVPESAWEFARELDALTGTEKFTVRLEQYPESA